jgi:urease accessory protein
MKFSLNTDFSKLPRAGSFIRAGEGGSEPFDWIVLESDQRHLRRRVLSPKSGGQVLVDLIEPVNLQHGDLLVLDDGRTIGIIAPDEAVYSISARDPVHLAELAWHIGNRHLLAAIEADRIVILRDPVIKDMLEGLGATVTETTEPFNPLRGAYSGQAGHHHIHDERDAFGRSPHEPHYGHNHP